MHLQQDFDQKQTSKGISSISTTLRQMLVQASFGDMDAATGQRYETPCLAQYPVEDGLMNYLAISFLKS